LLAWSNPINRGIKLKKRIKERKRKKKTCNCPAFFLWEYESERNPIYLFFKNNTTRDKLF